MASFLFRLGRAAHRWRWLVVAFWVAALAAVGIGAATASTSHDSGFSIPGTESQRASDLMQQRFDGTGAVGAYARIVFVAPTGQKVTAAAEHAAIEQAVAEVAVGPQVASAADPFQAGTVSPDGTTAYSAVTYKVTAAADLTDATKTALTDAAQHARAAGLTVDIGGNALAAQPAAGGLTEVVGIAAAALILLVTFGSLAAAGLPLLTALIGVGLGSAGIVALGSTFGLSESTGALATMLGLAATAEICADPDLSGTRILILTTFEIDEYVARALRVGASGFLGKDVSAEQLLAGIRTIAAGEALLSPAATRTLITRFLAAPDPADSGRPATTPEALAGLTAREREMMALAAEGRSNDEIAEALVVSPLTVRTHIHRAMMKLGARDRAQLVVITYQSGLVRPAQ